MALLDHALIIATSNGANGETVQTVMLLGPKGTLASADRMVAAVKRYHERNRNEIKKPTTGSQGPVTS